MYLTIHNNNFNNVIHFSSSPTRVCSPGEDYRQHSDLQEAEEAPETQVGRHPAPYVRATNYKPQTSIRMRSKFMIYITFEII